MLGNSTLPVTVGGHYTIGRYVLRHFVKREREGKVRLSGYGVELQIKSTEYKAQDDREVKGEGGEGSEGEVEELLDNLYTQNSMIQNRRTLDEACFRSCERLVAL